jgi:hypothetical protein
MTTSNAYDAHATYGDHVSIEFRIESKVPFDAFVDFITPRERMSPTSVQTTTNEEGETRFASTFFATRHLGNGGVYVDEGPMRFRIEIVHETTLDERSFVINGVTEGITVVFDSTAPYVVDAYLRPYVRNAPPRANAVRIGDIAVLYVTFSEPVDDVRIRMRDRDAFVSLASPHGDAFYGYVEISRAAGDLPGDEVSFEITAVDRAGNACFTCADTQTTDGSSLIVFDAT